jgi:Nif-specific regulatory protein
MVLPATAPSFTLPDSTAPAGGLSLNSLEQKYILETLERTNWNKSQTAALLGIERSTLDRKLKRYGVNRPE